MTEVAYCTRETVQHALNQADSVRNSRRIDAAVRAASRDVEGWTHRRFYPTYATRYPGVILGDFLDLDHIDHELLSVTSLVLAGTAAAGSDYYLTPEVPEQGHGYTEIHIVPGSSTSWPTAARAVVLTGTFGSSDTTAPAGTLAAAVATASTTTILLSDSSAVGVGDLLTAGTERMIVTGKSMAATGATVSSTVTDSNTVTTVTVSDGTLINEGELVQIDGERLFVESIAGNVLTVKRAQNASTIAAHVSPATVYAPRTAIVTRGVLGTTAATHSQGAALVRNDPPSLVQEATLALALNNLEQGRAGYAREVGQGESARESGGRGVQKIVDDLVAAYGRVRIGVAG